MHTKICIKVIRKILIYRTNKTLKKVYQTKQVKINQNLKDTTIKIYLLIQIQ